MNMDSESSNLHSANAMLSDFESISMANNNIVPHNGNQLESKYSNVSQQQQQQQQQYPQQPMPYHDPPYMIRHSRAFRHFKNPPQPHMCIKDHTEDGQELYINVMKWTKICMPHSASDPIPLYGGMRVTSGSSKTQALVFAVMANPAILKHVGRKCSDVEEKYALVKLMCDFVEAMNPGLKLARDAEVLKDRDLSGELKDIWGAVQAKRMREKDAAPSYENYLAQQNQIYIDFGPESSNQPAAIGTDAAGIGTDTTANANELPHNTQSNSQLISVLNVDEMDGPPMNANHIHVETNLTNSETTTTSTVNSTQLPQSSGIEKTNEPNVERQSVTSSIDNTPSTTTTDKANGVSASVAATVNADTQNSNNNQGTGKSIKQNASSTTTATNATSTTTTPKKDKLAGFLPNGCHNIFPFIKTKNSHDKNSNKDKTEHTAHNAHNGTRKSCSSTKDNNKFIQQNNTANLECELAKIDLSK